MEINYDRYLIVDDRQENLAAAKEYFQDSAFYVDSAKDAISLLNEKHKSIDLVITDLEMEHSKSGLDVSYVANTLGLASVIVSGGMSHGYNCVNIYPLNNTLMNQNKSEVNTWRNVDSEINNSEMIKLISLVGKVGSLDRFGFDLAFCNLNAHLYELSKYETN